MKKWSLVAAAGAVALLCYSILVNAWVCDDAYITFRTIDNVINGYGLTWNVAERVQAFTHPLWLFVLAVPVMISGEVFYTSITISVLCTILSVLVLVSAFRESIKMCILGILVLSLSVSFVHYATSGLENPLAYLLFAIFGSICLRRDIDNKSCLYLSLVSGLILLTRMDLVLLVVPLWLLYALKIGMKRFVPCFLTGMIPFFLWEVFSLFYYGFLFPNTAYAKLNTGIPISSSISQGLRYVIDLGKHDPLSGIVVAAAIVLPFILKRKKLQPLSLGLILYIIYIIYIGGCFMSGRFFSVPVVLSCFVVLDMCRSITNRQFVSVAVVIVIIGIIPPRSPVFSSVDDDSDKSTAYYGIVDERSCYTRANGFLRRIIDGPGRRIHSWEIEGRAAREKGIAYLPHVSIGMLGYHAGPEVYIMDANALTDPLLARLPAYIGLNLRPGHYTRVRPPGYEATLQSGDNQIENRELAEYYDRLEYVISGPLWAGDRLVEIVRFNLGMNDHLLDTYEIPSNIGKIRPGR